MWWIYLNCPAGDWFIFHAPSYSYSRSLGVSSPRPLVSCTHLLSSSLLYSGPGYFSRTFSRYYIFSLAVSESLCGPPIESLILMAIYFNFGSLYIFSFSLFVFLSVETRSPCCLDWPQIFNPPATTSGLLYFFLTYACSFTI